MKSILSLSVLTSFLIACTGGVNQSRAPIPDATTWSDEMFFQARTGSPTLTYLKFSTTGDVEGGSVNVTQNPSNHVQTVDEFARCGTFRVIDATTLGVDFGSGEVELKINPSADALVGYSWTGLELSSPGLLNSYKDSSIYNIGARATPCW